MEKEKKPASALFDVGYYGEDLKVVMTTPPKWPIRWGVFIVFLVFLVLLAVSYFIKYPDMVHTPFTLSSSDPSVKIIPRTSGRIRLLVKDKDSVKKGQFLGYIVNTADFGAIQYYQESRDSIRSAIINKKIGNLPDYQFVNLGELQDQYISLLNGISEYKSYVKRNDLTRAIVFLNNQSKVLDTINNRIKNEYSLNELRRSLGADKLSRDSFLFREKILSKQEYENSKAEYIPLQLNAESIDQSLKTNQSRIIDIQSKKVDLTLQDLKYLENLESKILGAFNDLEKAYLMWKEKYLFESPIDGYVTLFEIRDDNQYATADKELMNISSPDKPVLLGYSTLPVESSGKVRIGQKVIIDLSNYPSPEYGFLDGVVKSVSTLPKEGSYYVEIELPRGLTTDLHKILDYKERMVGTAGIVTEDMRLIERLFYNFRKLIKRQ